MTQLPNSPPLLQLRGISKRFAAIPALRDVRLELQTGEVLGLVGENGAGKSTLMRILAGIETPDAGSIRLAGQRTQLDSPQAAMRAGIAIIHQEIHLAPNLDVAANLFLGREPHRWGWIRRRAIQTATTQWLLRVGLRTSPGTLVRRLSLGNQQLVEIARALSGHARIVIMDEPTSSLSQTESETLFRVIRDLKASGVAIIYISHRLGEIVGLADRVTVLRDGRNAGELTGTDIHHDRMVQLMIGRDLASRGRHPHDGESPVALAVDRLVTRHHPQHSISLQLHRGECVGLAGLVGAGRSGLLRAIFGVDPPLAGTIRVAGKLCRIRHAADAMNAGLALVPEDRKTEGLILSRSVPSNINLPNWELRRWAGILADDRQARQDAQLAVDVLKIKSAGQPAAFLSGGNQQKVVLGKWIPQAPRVLLLDEPTRGVDVGARQELYQRLETWQQQGTSILFASSEMEEVLTLSDRVLVMHAGRLAGQLGPGMISEQAIMALATGQTEGPS